MRGWAKTSLSVESNRMKTKRTSDLLLVGFCLVLSAATSVPAQTQQPERNDQAPSSGQRGPGGPGGPGGGFFGGGFFGGGGSMLGLAMRDEVQQELQLVDEQKDKVRGIADSMGTKIRAQFDQSRDTFRQLGDLSDEERQAKFAEIRSKFEALNTDGERQLDKVLLPHQLDRLKQIDLQNKIQQRGASAITGGDVAKALNLTDEQRDKLEKRAAEVQQELQAKIRDLQADARKKMLDVLTSDQRAQLDKMMGQQFSLPEQNIGDRFRGRSGRGGPSGRRPGDQPGRGQPKAGNESI
jgi:Spy/CpxP family protein refolding chaperone